VKKSVSRRFVSSGAIPGDEEASLSRYHSPAIARMRAMTTNSSRKSSPDIQMTFAPQMKTIDEIKKESRPLMFSNIDASKFQTVSEDQKRKMIIEAFMHDEVAYEHALEILVKIYVFRLKVSYQLGSSIIDMSQLQDLFSNIEDIKDVTTAMLKDLQIGIAESSFASSKPEAMIEVSKHIAQILQLSSGKLSVYALYISNYRRAMKTYDELRESSPSFYEFVQIQEICEGLTLENLMALPLLRVGQYLTLLEDLATSMASVRDVAASIHSAARAVEIVLKNIHSLEFNIEARIRTAQIQEQLFSGSLNLLEPHRFFVKSGVLKKIYAKTSLKMSNHKKYMFFLFSDILVYATRPSSGSETCKFKHALSIAGATISEAEEYRDGKVEHVFKIVPKSEKSIVVYAAEASEKAEWMKLLKQYSEFALARYPGKTYKEEQLDTIMETVPKRIKSKLNWVECKTDVGYIFYWQMKTGDCSLARDEDSSKKTFESSGTLKFMNCTFAQCDQRALSGTRFCAVHSGQESFHGKSRLSEIFNDEHKFDDDEENSVESVGRTSSAVSAPGSASSFPHPFSSASLAPPSRYSPPSAPLPPPTSPPLPAPVSSSPVHASIPAPPMAIHAAAMAPPVAVRAPVLAPSVAVRAPAPAPPAAVPAPAPAPPAPAPAPPAAAPQPPSDGGDRSDLLASIRAGTKLKKVDKPVERKDIPTRAPVRASGAARAAPVATKAPAPASLASKAPVAPTPVNTPAPAPASPARSEPNWSKVFSEQYQQFYYWNKLTNEVTWIIPADYDGPS